MYFAYLFIIIIYTRLGHVQALIRDLHSLAHNNMCYEYEKIN